MCACVACALSAAFPFLEGCTTSSAYKEKHPRAFFRRFDCLGRRILVPKPDDFTTTTTAIAEGGDDDTEREEEKEGDKQELEGRGGGVQLIPGMLRSYDTSTGLFNIRYSHGNR